MFPTTTSSPALFRRSFSADRQRSTPPQALLSLWRSTLARAWTFAWIAALLAAVPGWTGHGHAQAKSTASRELTLAVGENKTLPAADVKSYSEGIAGIADVRVTPNRFVIVGKRPGSTTLLLILKDGSEVLWNIHVFAQAVTAVEAELRQLLDGLVGIRIRRVGPRFFIEGGVSSEEELNRIAHIASLYPGQVESLVVLGGAAADNKINIRVDVFFVQYEKNSLYQVGIDWPGRIGGEVLSTSFAYDFLSKSTTRATASIVDQPLPALDLASRNGYAKVLKHATVITSNGSEARFSNGGAQNYAVNSGFSASIQQVSFGTEIKVLPRFDPTSGEMVVQVHADVSDLTPSVGSDIPGQNTSTLETLVSLKLGESLILSGIHTQAKRSATSGLPLLSELPIIGRLFGTVGEDSSELEGAIFVIPGVIESPSQQAAELIEQALREYEEFDGDLETVAPTAALPPHGALPRRHVQSKEMPHARK